MAITNVSVAAAREAQLRGETYVDVRSTPEFNAGHAPGAVNVPLLEPDEDTGQLMPNPDFVRVMKATFAPDTPLVLGCQSGGRSARAAQMLHAFGYAHLSNVDGGIKAWQASGLPTDTSASTYDQLLARADANDATST